MSHLVYNQVHSADTNHQHQHQVPAAGHHGHQNTSPSVDQNGQPHPNVPQQTQSQVSNNRLPSNIPQYSIPGTPATTVYGVPHQSNPVQAIPAFALPSNAPSQNQPIHSPPDEHRNDNVHVRGAAGYFTQLVATIRRQLIQKRRMWGSWTLEVLLPALFTIGLLIISSVAGRDEYDPQNFASATGPIAMGQVIREQMLCHDGTNANTHPDLVALLAPCDTSAQHICLPTSQEIPIEGLCINGTFESALGQALSFLNVESDVEIPNFDEYVLWKWLAVTIIPAADNLFADRINQGRQPGRIYVAPDSGPAVSFTNYMNATHRLFKHTFGGYFASRDEAVPFIKALANEGKVWGVYEIIADTPTYLKYSLSMNTSAMNMLQDTRDEFSVGLGEKEYTRYTISGALTLQKAINDYHAVSTVGSADSDLYPTGVNSHLVITPMPLDSYVEDQFLMIAGRMAPLLLVLSFLYSVSQLAKRLVEEKEQRLREGTMIMGLSKGAFFSSWLFVYYVQMFVTSVIMTIIVKLGITKQSNWLIIFLAFFLYSITTVNMAALLSTFFNKSKIAALLVPLLYFVFAIPAFAIPQTTGPAVFHVLSFLCPIPFSVSLNLIFTHEINNGLGWNMAGSSKDRPYNYALCLFWYIFDFILYGLLLVYFDNVLPKDWGTTQHPCYCCCCCCRGRKHKGSQLASQSLDVIDNPRNHLSHATTFGVLQDYPQTNRHASVHINQLRKEFPGAHGKVNVAVNGMELRMFPDGITVFLGHNGAGKTTVMNMMTGMMSPTDGDVTIYGKSILSDMQEIRRDIGFCPQHNILWDDLTCMEHLQYFARLKGFSGAEVDTEAEEMLRKVDLLEKKDVFSKNLSGGQKRKLSVAIAFMGRARLVLLDEPTAGMDVAARRHTWDVLKDMSQGRTILLTTHYMDEADLLGSRIAIMSKGTLHSYGTPMFLKNNLGSGYVMRIASNVPITDPTPILREVQRVLPGASIKEAKGQELAITLPKEGARSFPAVIRTLDSPEFKRAHNISSVSVSVSSLEDVFLAIADHEEMEGKTQAEMDEEHEQEHAAFDALEHVYTRLQQKNRAARGQQAHGEGEEMREGAEGMHKIPTMGAQGSSGRQFRGMMMKRINHGRRDYCALCLQIVAPVICILIAMGLGEIQAPSPKRYYWDNAGLYEDVDQTTATNNCPAINDYFDTDFVLVDRQFLPTTRDFSGYLLSQFDNNGDRERMVSFSCNDTFGNNVLLVNATGMASAPQAVNQLYRAKLRAHSGNPAATIDAAQWPFPFTDRQMSQIDTISAVLVALFILIPFTFIPSTYVAFVVRERACKSKHLQFVSGAGYGVYWLANFVFDLASYLVTVAIAFIIFGIFDQEWTIGTANAGIGTFILFLFYGLSAIGFAYLVSFLFDNHSTAQTVIMMVNFIVGFLLVLLMFFLREIESTEDAAEVIRYFLLIVPPYALGDGLFAMVMANALSSINGEKSAFSTDVAGWNMIYMALLSIVFLAVTMFIDHPSREKRRELLGFKSKHAAPPVEDEDEDVARERAEVEKGQRKDDVVQVQGLRKEFDLGGGKQKIAVQNITFGVKPGEVFGFLGTNGAGKTTTMSMLTTEILPTCGHGRIGGYDIVQDSARTRRLIGYCPQFDAIMDLLTPAEHLRLFAALRGVEDTEEVVDALIKSCALAKYRDIPAGQLSGGNKRKLSVAMSLIGGPSIVFLDEPSAGMDPHARRQLWDVIIFVSKHSSVVLTTHHLEEVDVLAHRVGIMDSGLLKCLGSLEHLKLKFGSGFELTIQVGENGFKPATEFISHTYPTAVMVEARQHRILYTLPFDSTDLASLFEAIQRATDDPNTGIVDYTVQQTSLEQVFLRISELADNDNDENTRPSGPVAPGTTAVPVESGEERRQNSSTAYSNSIFRNSTSRRDRNAL